MNPFFKLPGILKDTAILRAMADGAHGKALHLRNLDFLTPHDVMFDSNSLRYEDFLRHSETKYSAFTLADLKAVVSFMQTMLMVVIDAAVGKAFEPFLRSLEDSSNTDLILFGHKYRLTKIFAALKGAHDVLLTRIKKAPLHHDAAIACYAHEVERGLREDMCLTWEEEQRNTKLLSIAHRHSIQDIITPPKPTKAETRSTDGEDKRAVHPDEENTPEKPKRPSQKERKAKRDEAAATATAAAVTPRPPKKETDKDKEKVKKTTKVVQLQEPPTSEFVGECFANIAHNLHLRFNDCTGPPSCKRTHASAAKPLTSEVVLRAVKILRRGDPEAMATYKAALKVELDAKNPLFKA